MPFLFSRIHHVQLSGPVGCEDAARDFYSGILGFTEIEKPAELKKRGGVWFRNEQIEIHIGIEEPFSPAKKAHPAFEIQNLEGFIQYIQEKYIPFVRDEFLPGYKRIYIHDPFGNRIEVLEKERN